MCKYHSHTVGDRKTCGETLHKKAAFYSLPGGHKNRCDESHEKLPATKIVMSLTPYWS